MFYKHFFSSRQKHDSKNDRVYLDFASSTPLDARMLAHFPVIDPAILGANPSALHREGVLARRIVEDARALVAKSLTAHADEIIFTSGATESDNLALSGAVQHFLLHGVGHNEIALFVSEFEHAAVSETVSIIAKSGVQKCILVAEAGVIDPKSIVLPLHIKVAIVSVMYVHNEIGIVQQIKDMAKRIRKLRKENPDVTIIFHIDATQAPLYYPLSVAELGVDMMTLGATKLHTHKGVGVLYKKRNIKLTPSMHGGGQEFGLRPGTEPVELIHAFAHALAYAQKNREAEYARIQELQNYFETKLLQVSPVIKITGVESERSPHITHIAIPNFDSELLVIELDARGIAVSSKSACKNDLPAQTGEGSESPIVESLYCKGYGAVRFSFGRTTTKNDLDAAVLAFCAVLKKYV